MSCSMGVVSRLSPGLRGVRGAAFCKPAFPAVICWQGPRGLSVPVSVSVARLFLSHRAIALLRRTLAASVRRRWF